MHAAVLRNKLWCFCPPPLLYILHGLYTISHDNANCRLSSTINKVLLHCILLYVLRSIKCNLQWLCCNSSSVTIATSTTDLTCSHHSPVTTSLYWSQRLKPWHIRQKPAPKWMIHCQQTMRYSTGYVLVGLSVRPLSVMTNALIMADRIKTTCRWYRMLYANVQLK